MPSADYRTDFAEHRTDSTNSKIIYPDHRLNNPASGDVIIEMDSSEFGTAVTAVIKIFAAELKLCAVGLYF